VWEGVENTASGRADGAWLAALAPPGHRGEAPGPGTLHLSARAPAADRGGERGVGRGEVRGQRRGRGGRGGGRPPGRESRGSRGRRGAQLKHGLVLGAGRGGGVERGQKKACCFSRWKKLVRLEKNSHNVFFCSVLKGPCRLDTWSAQQKRAGGGQQRPAPPPPPCPPSKRTGRGGRPGAWGIRPSLP